MGKEAAILRLYTEAHLRMHFLSVRAEAIPKDIGGHEIWGLWGCKTVQREDRGLLLLPFPQSVTWAMHCLRAAGFTPLYLFDNRENDGFGGSDATSDILAVEDMMLLWPTKDL